MFARRFFSGRYFAPRYFPGESLVVGTAHYIYMVLPEDRIFVIPQIEEIETILLVSAEDRTSIIPAAVVEERIYIVPAEIRIYEAPHD